MPLKMSEKVVVVTGGSGLIGRSIIDYLDQSDYKVINFDLNSYISGNSEWVECNVVNIESVKEALNLISEKYGQLYGVVNNAYPRTSDWGIAWEYEPFASTLKNVEMQMVATMHICKIASELISEGGSIINIASIYGVVGNDPTLYENTKISTAAAYSAIKGGLINFTRYLAARLGEKKIRVNCISPGGIFDNQDPAFVDRYEQRVPLKRMGKPSDIAPCVRFLISEEADYVTGHNLVVDGGWTIV
jgi:NAD(P)-dependent dehydrogenase (short-subunit alcohol dehydrogenase family)